jgi:riboflavin-specific deaminase-like protein
MNYPNYFCDHLNEVKQRIRSGDQLQFPVAYSKKKGFHEWEQGFDKIDFILSCEEMSFMEFAERKVLYNDILYVHFNAELEEEIFVGLRLFCPLIFVPLIIKNAPFIITHMAQTLDGKICTNSGHSKWIGNEENLIHAHRLRAMVDGVLVGGKTIANDLPKLNVRHVEGSNPVRLLLTNTLNDFKNLPKVSGMETYLLRRKNNPFDQIGESITKVIYYEGATESERLSDLLTKLKLHGIDSILLEGGSGTVSSFYKENKINWLQLHIAPMIFGSGKPFIQLSEINDVSEGRKLDNVFYNVVGDGVMMTGELK